MAVHRHLSIKNVERDPFNQFEKWYEERRQSTGIYPDAFSLATSTRHGEVSVRIVLLKDYNRDGFVFFTNYNSKKGRQLTENNRAAMLFYWPEPGRQIRIEGRVQKLASEESEKYFKTRPRDSRIGAWASEQSSAIAGRQELLDSFNDFREKFKGQNVPLPPHWGGFRIAPLSFEFWQEGKFRLHDRLLYLPDPEGWKVSRLAP